MLTPFTATPVTPLEILAVRHSEMLKEYPKACFELGCSRHCDPSAWLTTDSVDDNPSRVIIANSGGDNLTHALQVMAGSNAPESEDFIAIETFFRSFAVDCNYAYFELIAKPSVGWTLKISNHAVDTHSQYKEILSVVADNLHEMLRLAKLSIPVE